MIAMGGFMGAAALAARQGNKKKREQSKREADASAQARKQDAAIRAAASEYDVQKSASKAAAESSLGRSETEDEIMEREIKEFGFYIKPETREERVARTLKSLGI